MPQSSIRCRDNYGPGRRRVLIDRQNARRFHKVPGSVALIHVSLHGSDNDHHSFALLKSVLNSVTHLRTLLLTAGRVQRR